MRMVLKKRMNPFEAGEENKAFNKLRGVFDRDSGWERREKWLEEMEKLLSSMNDKLQAEFGQWAEKEKHELPKYSSLRTLLQDVINLQSAIDEEDLNQLQIKCLNLALMCGVLRKEIWRLVEEDIKDKTDRLV